MAYIDVLSLRGRLPRDGQGVGDEQLQEKIDSAIEEVSGLTGDSSGESALTREAVANRAQADALDIIFPRDARNPEGQSTILREAAEAKLLRWIEIDRSKSGDQDPTAVDVPAVVTYEVDQSY